MNDNALKVKVYSGGSTLLSDDQVGAAEGVTFATYYPGGLFGEGQFTVPRDVTRAWAVKAGQRVKFYNGLKCVYEGKVSKINYDASRAAFAVDCLGYWGALMMVNKIRKPWADTRLSEDVWVWDTALPAAEKCDTDRQNRLRFTPKAVAWLNTQRAGHFYTAPTGSTIKRLTFNYTLAEGAQSWYIGLYSNGSSTYEWSANTSGTAAVDLTLSVPASAVEFVFAAESNQTGVNDGTIYGEITNLVVYTETGSINLTEIAADVAAYAGELSANTTLIGPNTYSLVPFIADPPMTYADILTAAAGYGGASQEAWAVGIRESDLSSDDKPILFAEAQPALTDYDYALKLDDKNVTSGSFAQSLENIVNWVIVHYQDVNGRDVYLTPDDDADMKDTDSIALYGERHSEVIDVKTTSATTAKNYGQRYLAQHKDLQWTVDGGITVTGSIRKKNGIAPCSEIRAGQRVKIENFLSDLNGSGLTFLITATSYDDASKTCALTVGKPDWLAVTNVRLGQ